MCFQKIKQNKMRQSDSKHELRAAQNRIGKSAKALRMASIV